MGITTLMRVDDIVFHIFRGTLTLYCYQRIFLMVKFNKSKITVFGKIEASQRGK